MNTYKIYRKSKHIFVSTLGFILSIFFGLIFPLIYYNISFKEYFTTDFFSTNPYYFIIFALWFWVMVITNVIEYWSLKKLTSNLEGEYAQIKKMGRYPLLNGFIWIKISKEYKELKKKTKSEYPSTLKNI
ncbi:hypothetical protein D8X55_01165 [Malacoplasma penetrans]|uniref:hypothetical protein n=1 Tax=Malacoplasma penetrans TaxID=28227 RepID=UPI0005D1308E|nr:hypothetical protein [Malacoplasma penetrans]RXY97072.1 hypothetical protein D8X55_01165 [Malacoplasma penetrans]